MRPHVGAVVRDVDGHVADEADAAAPRLLAQTRPLPVEEELDPGVEVPLARELAGGLRERLGLARGERRRPVDPAGESEPLRERREERPVVEPGGLLGRGPERVERARDLRRRRRLEPLEGLAQPAPLPPRRGRGVQATLGEGRRRGERVLRQQPLLDEPLRRDEQRLAREGRARRRREIRRGRPERAGGTARASRRPPRPTRGIGPPRGPGRRCRNRREATSDGGGTRPAAARSRGDQARESRSCAAPAARSRSGALSRSSTLRSAAGT